MADLKAVSSWQCDLGYFVICHRYLTQASAFLLFTCSLLLWYLTPVPLEVFLLDVDLHIVLICIILFRASINLSVKLVTLYNLSADTRAPKSCCSLIAFPYTVSREFVTLNSLNVSIRSLLNLRCCLAVNSSSICYVTHYVAYHL